MTFIKENPVAALLIAVALVILLVFIVSAVSSIIKLVLMVIGLLTVMRWIAEARSGD